MTEQTCFGNTYDAHGPVTPYAVMFTAALLE
jgi:hypothetical protein